MPDGLELVQLVKRAAVQAVAAGAPAEACFGTVESPEPLRIRIAPKLLLERENLALCRSVTDYDLDMLVDHRTEPAAGGEGLAEYASHLHGYKGRKTFRVLGALCAGERVLLLRMQGGGKYIVVDRLEETV